MYEDIINGGNEGQQSRALASTRGEGSNSIASKVTIV